MPVQINELVIRTVLTHEDKKQPIKESEKSLDREAIVAECVEQVLAILNDRKER